jgi:MarR family transcriptional regulator, organic hydroperoxide resistance regulator
MKKSNKDFFEILKLDNQICFPLYAAARLIAQAYGPAFEELGLTYLQYIILLVLWEHSGVSVKEIGQRLLLDSGTLTPTLKKMEKSGLITRVRSSTDDRTVLNYPTKKTESLKRKAAKMSADVLARSGLSADAARNIRLVLKDLVVRLLRVTEFGQYSYERY